VIDRRRRELIQVLSVSLVILREKILRALEEPRQEAGVPQIIDDDVPDPFECCVEIIKIRIADRESRTIE
jgi:hypothetical protein